MRTRNLVLAIGLALIVTGSLLGAMVQDRKVDRAPLLAEGTNPQDARAQWEYKLRQFEEPKADLEKALNELGREGWEYVTVVDHGPVNQFGTQPRFTLFKRPLKK